LVFASFGNAWLVLEILSWKEVLFSAVKTKICFAVHALKDAILKLPA